MRRILFALLVLVLGACGSSGGETTPTTRPQNVRAAVVRAQLAEADLGGDWKLTGTEPPGTADASDRALEACVGPRLAVINETEAESGSRTFERGNALQQQQIVSSSAAFDAVPQVKRLFAVVGSDRYATCMARAFEDRAKADAGNQGRVSLEAGTPTVVRQVVAGADRSVHITDPVKVHLDQLTLDGRLDIVLLSTGRVVSMFLGFSIGDAIPTPQLAHLLELLLDRQHG